MAINVFGNPVTDDTVRYVFPNIPVITARDRATVAMMFKNADDRAVNASKFVHNRKLVYGDGTITLCVVFNATGGDLTFALDHPWEGEVWVFPYPSIIQNGQWGAYLHVPESIEGHSKEAVVYSGENNDGIRCDWMLAWNTAPMDFQNRVYTEIREEGHYETNHWDYIDGLMDKHTNSAVDTWNGCKSTITIGKGSSPELHAIMTLENVISAGDDDATTQSAQ